MTGGHDGGRARACLPARACVEFAWRIAVEAIDLVGEHDPAGSLGDCGPLHETDEILARPIRDKRPRQQRDYLLAFLVDEAGGPSRRSGDRRPTPMPALTNRFGVLAVELPGRYVVFCGRA